MAKRKQKVLQIVLIVIFGLLLFYIRLDKVHSDAVDELRQVVPSAGDSFTLKAVQKNVSFDEPTSAIIVSLRPGEEYEGSFLLKNSFEEGGDYVLSPHGFRKANIERIEDKIPDDAYDTEASEDAVLPVMTISENNVFLDAHEWKTIPYVIEVPEDTEEGIYGSISSLRKDQVFRNEGANLALAVGVEVKVEVTSDPTDYEYKDLIDDSEIGELAKKRVFLEVKKVFGVAFALLAIYFFYKAFSVTGDKKKN